MARFAACHLDTRPGEYGFHANTISRSTGFRSPAHEAIAERLAWLNDRPFKKLPGSLRELIETLDRHWHTVPFGLAYSPGE